MLLATVRSFSSIGLWGESPSIESDPLVGIVFWAGSSLLLGLFAFATLVKTSRWNLKTRFQPAILVVICGLFIVAAQQSPADAASPIVNELMRLDDSCAHVLFWMVVIAAIDALPQPSYRVMGTGAIAYAACSMVWVFLLGNGTMVNGVIVLVIVYALTVAAMHSEWFDAGHEESASGTSASEGARQAASLRERPCPIGSRQCRLALRQAGFPDHHEPLPNGGHGKEAVAARNGDIHFARARTHPHAHPGRARLGGKHREDPRRPHLRKARRQQPTGHDGPGARVKRRKTRLECRSLPLPRPIAFEKARMARTRRTGRSLSGLLPFSRRRLNARDPASRDTIGTLVGREGFHADEERR